MTTGRDFLGNEVFEGDMVAYVDTGAKQLCVGEVLKVTPKGFTVKNPYDVGRYSKSNRPSEYVMRIHKDPMNYLPWLKSKIDYATRVIEANQKILDNSSSSSYAVKAAKNNMKILQENLDRWKENVNGII